MHNLLLKIKRFLNDPFFTNNSVLFGLWTLLPIIAWIAKMHPDRHNNYTIFASSFWHAIEQLPLYQEYPQTYFDLFLYGPVFSLIVAPFSLLPSLAGFLLWLVTLSLTLYWAIQSLDLPQRKRVFILWFCAHELLTALFMAQFNVAVATLIIGSFVFIRREKECWAALCIVLGTFIKLYGVIGLAFFFFVHKKWKFVGWLILWSIIAFVAPMLLSSPDYIIGQYGQWMDILQVKNGVNMFSEMSNISVLGMVRKISGNTNYSDIWLIICGLIVLALPYLQINQYRHKAFQQAMLASMLLFVVLFSTGSESSTYIIPFVGVGIWYWSAPWKRSKLDIGLMVFAFILTSLSPSDLFPAVIRNEIIRPYALKALPCFIIWLKLIFEMSTRNYDARTI